MKTIKLTILAVMAILAGCTDTADITVTYTKGTAIYGDLEAIRSIPVYEGARGVIVNAGKLFSNEEFLLIGEEGEGIHVFNNADSENPTAIGFLNIPGNREFYVKDNTIFAESFYDMVKIDISDPMAPRLVTRLENAISSELTNMLGETLIGFEFETVTEKIHKDDDIHAQIMASSGPLYYDYEQNLIPPSAVPTSFAGSSNFATGSINRIAELDGYVYVIGNSKLSVYDNNGEFRQIFSNFVGWQMETVFPFNDRLFIGTRNSVDIYNISDPANPAYESGFWHATSCDPVLPVDGDIAYATLRTGDEVFCPGDDNSLVVLDVSNLNFVDQLQEFDMESPYGLTMIDDRLYVGEGPNGLKIFDASNRRNLQLIEHDRSIQAYDVLAHPLYTNIVMIAGPEGFSQYRIEGGDIRIQLSTIAF